MVTRVQGILENGQGCCRSVERVEAEGSKTEDIAMVETNLLLERNSRGSFDNMLEG